MGHLGGPKVITWVLRGGRGRQKVTEGDRRIEVGWRDAVLLYLKVGEGRPKLRHLRAASGSWKKQGKIHVGSFQRDHGPTDTLISDVRPSQL